MRTIAGVVGTYARCALEHRSFVIDDNDQIKAIGAPFSLPQ